MSKTYRFDATFYISDQGEITIDDDQDINHEIERLFYAVSTDGGYSLPWDDVTIQYEFVDSDEEDEDE